MFKKSRADDGNGGIGGDSQDMDIDVRAPLQGAGCFWGWADTRVPAAPFAITVGPVGAGMR
jgi:hypothetical protein